MRYIISAGGTGGHIYPALSIINKIKEEDKNAKITYIGTTDRMEKDIVPNMQIDYVGIKMNGISKNPKKLFGFIKNTILGKRKCKKLMKKLRPDVVIGVGGYITVPVVLAAHSLKIKVVLHEQNSIPGKANLLLSKYAHLICISMESSEKYFKHDNVVLTGNPRGEDILNVKKGRKKDYDLQMSKKLVLITMGSLGAGTINNEIISIFNKLKNKPYEVLLVTGKAGYEEVVKHRAPSNVKIVSYIDNMGEVLKFTDLIVTRAGATIIAEITSLGMPSILIPSPYVANNHQVINAEDLEKSGAAKIIREDEFKGDTLLNMIDEILENNTLYKNMSSSSKKLGITDSSTRIYKSIKKLFE